MRRLITSSVHAICACALLGNPALALDPPPAALDSLLFCAAKEGDMQRVVQLIDQQPSLVNAVDSAFGATPLHWAAYKGYEGLTLYLLENGADATAKNDEGKMPIQLAEQQRQMHAQLGQYSSPGATGSEVALLSLSHSGYGGMVADQQISEQIGQTSLTRDVVGRYDSVIRALQRPEFQRPPIQAALMAARMGDLARLRILVRATPALAAARDPLSGETPLHAAAAEGFVDVVSFLLLKGADAEARDAAGLTAGQIAQKNGQSRVLELLPSRPTTQ